MNDLIYVYCITKSSPVILPDIDSGEIKSLRFDDVFVIVKYVSQDVFSEENFKLNLSDIQWVDANARAHIGVIISMMDSGAVIPFKFGTIFNNKENLKQFLSDYSDSIIENFTRIEGKEEWSVKVYCDRKKLSCLIDELSEDAAAMEKQIMASMPGKAFLLQRKKADLIENELDRICKVYGQEYFDKIKTISDSTRLCNLIPREFTGRDDNMILNANFLIKRENVAELGSTVEALRKKDGNSGFKIEASGPWPPFSFIEIKEK